MSQKVKKGLKVFILFIVAVMLVACERDFLLLESIQIEAYDQISIEPGEYTVEYTIEDLDQYVEQYDIKVEIVVVNQDDEVILVEGNTFHVVEDWVYQATIRIIDMKTEEVIVEKTITIRARSATLTELIITQLPNKTGYTVGEVFDPSGMKVIAVYSNNREEEITDYQYKTEGLTLTDTNFWIEYLGLEAALTLIINDAQELAAPSMLEIVYDWFLQFSLVDGADSYVLSINDVEYVIETTFVDLKDYVIEDVTYSIKVKAIKEGAIDSTFSESIQFSTIVEAIAFEQEEIEPFIEGDSFVLFHYPVWMMYEDGRKVYIDTSELEVSITRPLEPSDTEILITHTKTGKSIAIVIEVLAIASLRWTVTFAGNGGALLSGEEVQEVGHKESATPPIYVHKSLVFVGWSGSYENVTEDRFIEARWIDPNAGTAGLLFEPIYNNMYQAIAYKVSGYGGGEKHVVIPSVHLGEPVTEIASNAFIHNQNIESVTLSSSIVHIGSFPFFNCKNLTEIHVSIENTKFASKDGLLYNKALDTLLLVPEGFSGTLSLKEGVVGIARNAARNVLGLQNLLLPSTLTFIEEGAFFNTEWLASQEEGIVYAGNIVYTVIGRLADNTHIELPETVVGIAGAAFEFQTGIVGINLPYGLITIGSNAFQGCSSLTEIIIPATVVEIGYSAFRNATNLETIFIADSVNKVAANAFDFTRWHQTRLPGVIYLGNIVLGYKGEMLPNTSILLKEGTRLIADGAFMDLSLNHHLTNIYIPDSLTSIGASAFSGAKGLRAIFLPTSVTTIHLKAFENTAMTIYAEASGPSDGWHLRFNPDPREVIFNALDPIYSVEFTLDFGEVAPSQVMVAPFLSSIPLSPIPGYRIVAWYTNIERSGDPIEFPFFPMKKENMTLYAEWEVATHRVVFDVLEDWCMVNGDIEVYVLHGSDITDPPMVGRIGQTFVGWDHDLTNITEDLVVRAYRSRLIVVHSITQTNVYTVSIDGDNLPMEIKFGSDVGAEYISHEPGTVYSIQENMTVYARVWYQGSWVELDYVEITDIDSNIPTEPMVRSTYHPETNTIVLTIVAGEKKQLGDSEIAYTTYRVNKTGEWYQFIGTQQEITCPNGSFIEVQTTNTSDVSTVVKLLQFDFEEVTFVWNDTTTTRYRLQRTEFYPSGHRYVETMLLTIEEDTMVLFAPKRVNSIYIGCGPKAAEMFLEWFGVPYSQEFLVANSYIRTQVVGFMENSIFTSPAQLESGINKALWDGGFHELEAHRRSPNTTNETIPLIEGFLMNGYPVIILSDGGEHYELITVSRIIWDSEDNIVGATFVTHDNAGTYQKTWNQLSYFFEDNLSARIIRAIGYSSYQDMILSLRPKGNA